MPVDFPDEFFGPPSDRGDDWPDFPELRSAVVWFKSFMTEEEWRIRRAAAANRLYDAALGQIDPGDKGRFFDEADIFGWYLFLGDAFLDHSWNYEPMFGSRVIPVLAAIGKNLDLLRSVSGIGERVQRLVRSERRQPNGGLFELLVAAAYRRAGADVAFVAEQPGRAKTYDLDVTLRGKPLAVECKRMETGAYGERERARMRELRGPSSAWLSKTEKTTFCDAHFLAPIDDVPAKYLTSITKKWLASGQPSLLWSDETSYGAIGELDLVPLQATLADNRVMISSNRILELLSGRYRRNENFVQVLRLKRADNPRYLMDCDLAILLRWESLSASAIDAKARDIIGKLAEATEQLPVDRPGAVHIGFEAVEGDAVERARYEKILASARRFDPGDRPLEYVYCHYFVPESPPDGAWAFDETTQWCGIHPSGPPLGKVFLILPDADGGRTGTHWEN